MSTSFNCSGRLRPLSSIQFTPVHKTGNKTGDTLDLFRRSVLIAFVMDRNEPKTRFTQPRMSLDLLMLKSHVGMKSSLVEYLRSELAEFRMKAPRLFQEQALIRGNRLLAGEQVFKGRNRGAVRMTTLDRLLQLLRVAEQNDVSRRLRNGQHVRQ